MIHFIEKLWIHHLVRGIFSNSFWIRSCPDSDPKKFFWSGSGQKFLDPDPQHCRFLYHFAVGTWVLWILILFDYLKNAINREPGSLQQNPFSSSMRCGLNQMLDTAVILNFISRFGDFFSAGQVSLFRHFSTKNSRHIGTVKKRTSQQKYK